MNRTSIFVSKVFDPSEPRIYSNNILLLDSNVATQEQVDIVICDALKKASKIIPHLQDSYKLNTVFFSTRTADGMVKTPSGYSYLWVKDCRFFNVLLGKKPDGSPLVSEIDDPNWIKPKVVDEYFAPANHKNMWFHTDGTTPKSWFEVDEECLEMERLAICPKIQTPLPPLIKITGIQHTKQQMEFLKSRGIDSAFHIIKFTAAHFGIELEKRLKHILICKSVPNHVTEKDIKQILSQFVSDPEAITERRVGNTSAFAKHTYPVITSKRDNYSGRTTYFAEFDQKTQDARFALVMIRYYQFDRNTSLRFELFEN
jgi:hypothetical protein